MQKVSCCIVILSFLKTVAQTPAQEIDEMLKQYARQNSFNGVAFVAQKGKILLDKGYGYKNMRAKTLNDSNTIFQIGSITKQFTATIILQLQERHKLSVQDRLSKYISGFPHADSITIKDLLTHTAGIYDYTKNEDYMKNDASRPIRLDSLIALFKNKPLDFSPGTSYSYSNSGYVLLGYMIEKITGKSYFTVVRENIFLPLGMTHSGFDFKDLKSPDKATGYAYSRQKPIQPAWIVDSSVSFSAGSVYTSVADLYKWDQALYTDKIIHDSSLRMAFTPNRNNYGFGWVIDSSYDKKVVMHEGSIYGFVSFIARIPADQICIILLDNKSSPGLPKIAENINSVLNQQPYDFPRPHHEIAVDTSVLRQYVGQYQIAPNIIITISVLDGALILQTNGQNKNELFAEKENFFFLKLQDIRVEFIKNVEGKVESLVFYQRSQKIPALKIN
jgi:CubicO group peptidase (beta-lactamase class C family)